MQTIQQVFPDIAIAPGMVLGATDSRHYRDIADNIYRFVPMRLTNDDLSGIHGTNERISIENYTEIIRFYVQLMRNAVMHHSSRFLSRRPNRERGRFGRASVTETPMLAHSRPPYYRDPYSEVSR